MQYELFVEMYRLPIYNLSSCKSYTPCKSSKNAENSYENLLGSMIPKTRFI